MCGRFVLIASLADIVGEFDVMDAAGEIRPRYNIAPGSEIAAVVRDSANRLTFMKWGLIPSWAKDPAVGGRLINARAETLSEKPSFRDSFRKRRCLIPASGYYEWRKAGSRKIPHYVHLRADVPFGMAGLYDTWTSPGGEKIRTCAIITKDADARIRPIHDRMPAVIAGNVMDTWLDPAMTDVKALHDLLASGGSEPMEAYEVSTLVNSPKNDSPRLIERINP